MVGGQIGGVPPEQVAVHTTYLGGGFGRRFELDFIVEALETSKAAGAPVKVIWSREDDIQHAQYRPANYHQLRAGLDASRRPVSWTRRVIAACWSSPPQRPGGGRRCHRVVGAGSRCTSRSNRLRRRWPRCRSRPLATSESTASSAQSTAACT